MFYFTPNPAKGSLNLLLEAGNQFAVGGDQRLFGFDLEYIRVMNTKGRVSTQYNLKL
jgi:hypothetical protein